MIHDPLFIFETLNPVSYLTVKYRMSFMGFHYNLTLNLLSYLVCCCIALRGFCDTLPVVQKTSLYEALII